MYSLNLVQYNAIYYYINFIVMHELELYLKKNNIKQIYLSDAILEHKNSLLCNIKIIYDNVNDPTLFYGMYRESDINTLINHKGDAYILWHDNDCNPNYKSRINNVNNITKLHIKEHICYNETTSQYLNKLNVFHTNIKISNMIKKDNDNGISISSNKNTVSKYCLTYISTINDVFEKIYVINMTKDVNKRNDIINKMSELNIEYEFFEGIDGSTEPYISEYNEYKKLPYNHNNAHHYEKTRNVKTIRSSGAYGYLVTWKKILEHSIETKYNNILVFDDDVIFDNNFHAKFNNFINEINKNWKIITLGVSQHKWNKMNIIDSYYHTPEFTDGSFAIGIDYSVFNLLLDKTCKFNCAFDSGPVRHIYKTYNSQCFTSYPNIVIADVSVSTIGGSRDMAEFSKKMKWDLTNFNINLSKSKNLVTIIVPMYNAECTIDMSLQSLIDQTYYPIEIIVVNDASTDKSKEKVESFINKYGNIKLINLNENSGCYVARNTGIKAANGKYIGFHDSDDISLPTRIEQQVIVMDERNILLCGCDFSRTSEKYSCDNINKKIKIHGKSLNIHRARFGLVTILFKREVFDLYGLYREDYRHSMDAELIDRIYFRLFGQLSKMHIHTLLCTNNHHNKSFYYKINKLLYISMPMTDNNISVVYENRIRDNVRKSVLADILNNNIP